MVPPRWNRFSLRDPWEEMQRLRRELNRVFNGAVRPAAEFPAVNVWTNDDSVLVTAELPGMKIEDINLSVLGDTLTIQGARKPEDVKEGETVHRRERGSGEFVRTIRLPYSIESDNVEARYSRGVLEVTLPRAEADKPKKIALKAE